MRKKHSLLAKLLILVLCFALVLAGCNGTKDTDAGKADDKEQSSNQTGTENGPDPQDEKPKTPEAQLTSSAGKTFAAMLNAGDSANVMDDVFTKGKITIEALGMLENVLYIDSANTYLADELVIDLGGQKMEASVFADGSALAVVLPTILGEDAYGVDLTTLAQDLKDSAIWEVAGISYEEFIASTNLSMGTDPAAIIKMLSRVSALEKALEEASSGVTFSSAEGKVTIYGEEVDATLITVHLTSDDIEKMVLAYMEWLEEVLKEELADLADDQVETALTESFDEYEKQIQEGFDEFVVSLDAVVAIDPTTEYMMSFDMDLEGKIGGVDDRAIRMDLILGKDPSNSDKYTFNMSAESEGKVVAGVEAVLSWSTAGDVDSTELKVSATEAGKTDEVFYGALNYDNSKKTYILLAKADGSELKLEGGYEHTEKLFDLSVDTLTVDGQTMELDVKIRAEEVDDVPQMPQFKNILQMSEDELNELFGQFG